MTLTLERELLLWTSLLDEPALHEISIDDGFFAECIDHDSCRAI